MTPRRSINTLLFAGIAGIVLSLAAAPLSVLAQVSAEARIEKRRVFLGEPVTFQIVVEGDENPKEPDLSGVQGFEVSTLGGRRNSRSSVTIVNGQVTQTSFQGYVFNYRLTPTRLGELVIPPITVQARGTELRTESLKIQVTEPSQRQDIKLRLEVGKNRVYVGEPLLLTITWYIARDVEEYSIALPVLNDPRFRTAELAYLPPGKGEEIKLLLDGKETPAKKFETVFDGQRCLAIRFERVIIPLQPGELELPPASVAGSAIVGYKRPNSVFGGVFDDDFFHDDLFSGFGRRPVKERFVANSNRPLLSVQPLPAEGRPTGFNGLVGSYSVIANAAPTEVNVGDPITLNIEIAGPDYMGHVTLPSLDRQEDLARYFKIPREIAAPTLRRGVAAFTQTIRAKNAGVRSIPAIKLPYFDSERGMYAVAESDPIPLTVKPARLVTAADAEGGDGIDEVKQGLQQHAAGIAHNYRGPAVFARLRTGRAAVFGGTLWLALLIAGPVSYAILWLGIAWRRGGLISLLGSGRKRRLRSILANVESASDSGRLLELLREYLTTKLALPPGAVTYADVRAPLDERGVRARHSDGLKSVIEQLEAAHFARQAADLAALRTQVRDVILGLEEDLR